MRMDIENFNILNAIVEENSFTKAAEKLHRTQSSISYQIKKLEENLGVDIFDRSDYRAKLTAAGKAIWVEGQRLIKTAEKIKSLALLYQGGWEPNLYVVVDGALPMEPVMHVLKIIADMDISTKIQVKTEFLGGVQKHFEKKRADMMIVLNNKPNPLLYAHVLKEKSFVLVASNTHPLSSLKIISYDQILEHVELTIPDSSGSVVDDLLFGCDRVFYLSDFVSKKNAIVMGLGFGWMPEGLIENEILSGELVELNYVAGSRHTFNPQLVYSVDTPIGKTAQIFRDLILQKL